MPKHVSHSVAEPIAQPRNDFVRGMAIGAGIAAVLDEGHVGIGVSEDMIPPFINRAIQSGGSCMRHKE
jgi:hypothetical protein